MRIVHFIEYFQPELGYQEYSLASEQSNAGHEVRVITSDHKLIHDANGLDGLSLIKVSPGHFVERGVSVSRLQSRFSRRPICALRGVEAALKEFQPDAVHVHGVYYGWNIGAIVRAKTELGFTLLVDDHAMPSNTDLKSQFVNRLHYELAFKRWLWPKLRRSVDHFVPIGQEELQFFRQHTGFRGSNVTVIPLGANLELFSHSEVDRVEIRLRLGIPANSFVAVHAGKLTPRKDPKILLLSWKRVFSRNRDARLLMITGTEGSYIQELKEFANLQGVGDSVVWHPIVPNDELPAFFSAADIGVWPGDPSSVIREAVANSLPVILPSSESGGHLVSDDLVSAANGLLFERGNSDSLADCVVELMDDSAKVKGMASNSRRLAEEQLGWGSISDRFIDLYAGN